MAAKGTNITTEVSEMLRFSAGQTVEEISVIQLLSAFEYTALMPRSLKQAHHSMPLCLVAPMPSQFWQDYLIVYRVTILVTLKLIKMGNLLYIIAVILIIGWLLGNFAFNVGGII